MSDQFHGYIPFLFGFWQRRGLRWLGPIIVRYDDRVEAKSSDDCPWCFGSHGCDRRKGHRGDHRCGIHWAWPPGEGFICEALKGGS